jgi:hypothetical protein
MRPCRVFTQLVRLSWFEQWQIGQRLRRSDVPVVSRVTQWLDKLS